MPMKKKPRAPARGAAKRRQPRVVRKAAPPRLPSADRASGTTKRVPDAIGKATIRRLKRELVHARKQIEELQASADTDFLLGVFNRRGFERELDRAIAFIQRYHARGALIVLDVDRLKPVNDIFGHAAGDKVLKAIVAAITKVVRASDLVGRLGGDEFGLLLWNLSETDARAKAASLEQAIDQLSFAFGGRTATVGASAGVALLDAHTEAGKALEEADSAMYVRKAQRRHEGATTVVAARPRPLKAR
jgi:diguanylate cyclase (GGDEF)-like protein